MYPKGYRGFEFLSLRHAVCTAEKTACNSCEIARLGRNCANLSRKADRRKCPAQSCRQAFAPFSLGGIRAVRFQGLYQANALRSQTDDVQDQNRTNHFVARTRAAVLSSAKILSDESKSLKNRAF